MNNFNATKFIHILGNGPDKALSPAEVGKDNSPWCLKRQVWFYCHNMLTSVTVMLQIPRSVHGSTEGDFTTPTLEEFFSQPNK